MRLIFEIAGVVIKGVLWLAAWWFLLFHQNMSGLAILAAWAIMNMDMDRTKTPFVQSGADSNHPKSMPPDHATGKAGSSTTEAGR